MDDSSGGFGVRAPFAVTTFRITQTQWRWLREQALVRAATRGCGKPDASEVLRELLEAHLGRGG